MRAIARFKRYTLARAELELPGDCAIYAVVLRRGHGAAAVTDDKLHAIRSALPADRQHRRVGRCVARLRGIQITAAERVRAIARFKRYALACAELELPGGAAVNAVTLWRRHRSAAVADDELHAVGSALPTDCQHRRVGRRVARLRGIQITAAECVCTVACVNRNTFARVKLELPGRAAVNAVTLRRGHRSAAVADDELHAVGSTLPADRQHRRVGRRITGQAGVQAAAAERVRAVACVNRNTFARAELELPGRAAVNTVALWGGHGSAVIGDNKLHAVRSALCFDDQLCHARGVIAGCVDLRGLARCRIGETQRQLCLCLRLNRSFPKDQQGAARADNTASCHGGKAAGGDFIIEAHTIGIGIAHPPQALRRGIVIIQPTAQRRNGQVLKAAGLALFQRVRLHIVLHAVVADAGVVAGRLPLTIDRRGAKRACASGRVQRANLVGAQHIVNKTDRRIQWIDHLPVKCCQRIIGAEGDQCQSPHTNRHRCCCRAALSVADGVGKRIVDNCARCAEIVVRRVADCVVRVDHGAAVCALCRAGHGQRAAVGVIVVRQHGDIQCCRAVRCQRVVILRHGRSIGVQRQSDDAGVVVADLIEELCIDMHYIIDWRCLAGEVVADQNLAEDFGITLEHVAVTLV